MENKCPNCGHCPTCGRADFSFRAPTGWPTPYYPYGPSWIYTPTQWINPHHQQLDGFPYAITTSGTITITSNGYGNGTVQWSQ